MDVATGWVIIVVSALTLTYYGVRGDLDMSWTLKEIADSKGRTVGWEVWQGRKRLLQTGDEAHARRYLDRHAGDDTVHHEAPDGYRVRQTKRRHWRQTD